MAMANENQCIVNKQGDKLCKAKETFTIFALDNYESLTNDVYNEIASFSSLKKAQEYTDKNLNGEQVRIVKDETW